MQRAVDRGIADSGFAVSTATAVGLASACATAAMSIDSLQYVPDKRATFREVARLLRPGGRFVFTAFEA
jgi:ubiquinone/menaquinone biosynthesis C-methylase UbiE